MAFSFIEIEEKKSRVILLVFLFIVLFYFLTAYFLLVVIESNFTERFFLPPLPHAVIACFIALLVASIHYQISISNLIPKISSAIGAQPVDEKDTYHRYFKNIVDEVAVAIGGRPIEAMVIPSSSSNAFSLQDFHGRSVIGVTEGLLARLNRSQVEAVVAHEAGHIASGDSLSASVISSLSEIYEESLNAVKRSLRRARGRGAAVLILVFLVLTVMNFFSLLFRLFLSRQREYRADAVAVRLTRNPLSLSEALKMISTHWRGAEAEGARLESIFILNPCYSMLDEREGVISNLFSTHPPVKERIDILLGMAHLSGEVLEENLRKFRRISPVALAEFNAGNEEKPQSWFIFKENVWMGPFLLEELRQMKDLKPDQWVRPHTGGCVKPVYEDPVLQGIFHKDGRGKKQEVLCPHCKTGLAEVNYEGVPLLKCVYCEGVLVEENKLNRVFVRRDMTFSEPVKKIGDTIVDSLNKHKFVLKPIDMKPVFAFNCPKCRQIMRRQFFAFSYPVEIDRCVYCGATWFDRQELEVLQYLYEKNNKE